MLKECLRFFKWDKSQFSDNELWRQMVRGIMYIYILIISIVAVSIFCKILFWAVTTNAVLGLLCGYCSCMTARAFRQLKENTEKN